MRIHDSSFRIGSYKAEHLLKILKSENGSEFGIEYTEEQFKEWMQDGTIHVSYLQYLLSSKKLLTFISSNVEVLVDLYP